MQLDARLEKHLHRQLAVVDDAGTRGSRLVDDARRLCARLSRFLAMGLGGADIDQNALGVACHALQLPAKTGRASDNRANLTGRPAVLSLRERCEQAAELLVAALADPADAALLERTVKILRDLPQRKPETEESRLLADALNLDDFGMTGVALAAMQLSRQYGAVTQLADGYEKRREYGYWDARLKDGFHFEQVREIARARLRNADAAIELLTAELKEDQAI
jgi:hypothetical protein